MESIFELSRSLSIYLRPQSLKTTRRPSRLNERVKGGKSAARDAQWRTLRRGESVNIDAYNKVCSRSSEIPS